MSEVLEKETVAKETPKSFDDIVITEEDVIAAEKRLDEEAKQATTDENETGAETETEEKAEKTVEAKEETGENVEEKALEEGTEEKEEKPKDEVPGDPLYAIGSDGKEKFTEAEIRKWQEDSENMLKFRQSNSEKSREIARQRKSLDGVFNFINKFQNSGDAIKDSIDVMREEFGDDVVDAVLKFKPGKFDDPFKEDLKAEKDRNAELEQKLALIESKESLCRKYGISRSKADKIHEFAKNKYDMTGEILSLETAYEQMQIPELRKALEVVKSEKDKITKEKASPELTVVPDKGKGAQGIKGDKPRTYEGAREAIINDPRLKNLY